MKTALVCIAKNEDHYIDEWLQYHLKLGFDDIFIFQNNWRYCGNMKNSHVKLIEWDINRPDSQALSYNTFISSHISNSYDFAAFFDVDEFLALKQHICVSDFLSMYQAYDAIGINWRIFGDNGYSGNENIGYSCLNRFIKCGKNLNKHVKLIINLNKIDKSLQTIHSYCVHYTLKSINADSTINVAKKHFIHGPFNEFDLSECLEIAYLNHYRNKTRIEAIAKSKTNSDGIFYYNKRFYIDNFDEQFNEHNINEVEDITALQFYMRGHNS